MVAGTRGLTGWKKLLLGSTAAQIVRGADVPVLVVHPEDAETPRRPRTVLVPTDFSEDATRAVDAAILLPPFNFQAEAQGFNSLGLTVEYAPELPFSGTAVNKAWAGKNEAILKRLLAAHSKSLEWFYDDKNRDESIKILTSVSSLKPDDVSKSYDFFRKNNFFDKSGTISRKKMEALLEALQSLGDIQAKGNVERFVMQSVTKISD